MGVDYSKAFKNFNVNIGGHVTPLWFDGNYYRIQSSVLTGIQKSVTKSWRLASRLMLRKTNNNENELLDTDDYSLKLTSQHFFDNWRFSLSAERLVEDGQVDSNSRTIDSLSLNSFWLLNQQWLTAIDLSFQQHEYEGTHPYYLEEREDDVWLFSSFVQYNLSKTFSYRLNINVQDKNSNLDLFSYNRSEISLSASMNF